MATNTLNTLIQNMFNQVGTIINAYAPEHFQIEFLAKKDVFHIKSNESLDELKWKSYKNVKTIFAPNAIDVDLTKCPSVVKVYVHSCLNNQLGGLLQLEELRIKVISCIETLKTSTRLRSIYFGTYDDRTDMFGLFQELESLVLPQLSGHKVWCHEGEILKYVSMCKKLKVLELVSFNPGDKTNYTQLECLSKCEKLELLNLRSYRNHTNKDVLKPLSSLSNLKLLNLFNFTSYHYDVLTPLAACISLERLILSNLQINDNNLVLGALKECKNLESLDLQRFVSTNPKALVPLQWTTQLKLLNLHSFTNTNKEALKPLAFCKDLDRLDIGSYTGNLSYVKESAISSTY